MFTVCNILSNEKKTGCKKGKCVSYFRAICVHDSSQINVDGVSLLLHSAQMYRCISSANLTMTESYPSFYLYTQPRGCVRARARVRSRHLCASADWRVRSYNTNSDVYYYKKFKGEQKCLKYPLNFPFFLLISSLRLVYKNKKKL